MGSRFALVPSELFSEDKAGKILSEVVPLCEGEPLSFLEIPQYGSVLVYAGGQRPAVYDILMSLFKIKDYNKIAISLYNDVLSLVIAQGNDLKFCNEFQAADFTTAQYFIFMVLKQLQINPEISTIFSLSPLDMQQTVSFCKYFKTAEQL